MSFTHSKNARIWMDQYELTNQFNDFMSGGKAGIAETTVYGLGAKTFIGGLKEGQISGKGYFDDATNKSDQILTAALGRNLNMNVTFIPNGVTTIGTRVLVAYSALIDYSVTAPVAGVVATAFAAQADSGLTSGVLLTDPTAALITIATFNSTGNNDRGLATLGVTSGGFVALLHVLTLTGTGSPSLTVKIQHSDDDATYVDLCSFNGGNPITAPGAYAAFVPYGTAISRYIRAVRVTAGTTISTTSLVSAARQ